MNKRCKFNFCQFRIIVCKKHKIHHLLSHYSQKILSLELFANLSGVDWFLQPCLVMVHFLWKSTNLSPYYSFVLWTPGLILLPFTADSSLWVWKFKPLWCGGCLKSPTIPSTGCRNTCRSRLCAIWSLPTSSVIYLFIWWICLDYNNCKIYFLKVLGTPSLSEFEA